jgi:hypothetical protein
MDDLLIVDTPVGPTSHDSKGMAFQLVVTQLK